MRRGFTLAELIVAMTVTGIILAAVATLAFVMSSANDSADNTSEIQSRIRYTTVRFDELIRNSKLLCRFTSTEVALWKADYNNDNLINPAELVYIESGAGNDCIKLLEFQPTGAFANTSFLQTAIADGSAKTTLMASSPYTYATLINSCHNVIFTTNLLPGRSKRLDLSFDISQNGITQNYQCSAFLRLHAEYLLYETRKVAVKDDD